MWQLRAAVLAAGMMAATAAAAEPAELMREIPDTTCAFVVVHDLAGMCAKADGFLDAIGVDKADRAGGALAELARGLKLKALGGRGGAALVVADFKALGLDPSDTLLGLMSDRTGAPSLAGVPVVAYLPGADPAALLAEYEPRKDGALWTFQTPAGAMQAGVRNGYTLVSAMPAALQWALAATKPIAGRLTRQDLDVITRNDAAAYVDMAVASRIYVDFVFQTYNLLMQKMVTDQAAMAKDLRGVVEALCQDISQMTGASAGLRFEKGGVVGEMLAAYEPQSVRGRFHTGGGVTQRELLHRLPVMPYWVAFGADWSALGQARVAMATQQGRKFAAQWRLFTIVAEAAKMTMPPAVAGLGQQIEATWTAFGRQVSGVQLVVGPGAGGEGSLAGAVALTCADAGEVRSLLARATELADKAARVMFPLQEGAWLSYTRSAGGEGVDQIELTLPEALQAVVTKLTGQKQLALPVAAAGGSQVVAALGGGAKLLEQSQAAAQAGRGGLVDPKDLAEASAVLPRTMSSLTVLRMGRFFRGLGLLTGMRRPAAQEQAESGPSPASRPAAGNEPPIVMATENLAAAERTVVFVPAGAAADVVEWFKSVIPKPKYPQARQAEDRERQLAEEKVEQAKRAAEESKKQYEERTRLLKEREKALLEELKKSSQGPEPGP